MEKLLENQRIVVAGGSSGIGLALVKMLSEDGGALTAIGRDQQKLQELCVQLPSMKGVALDARDRLAMECLFMEEGSIDHLVLALSGAKGGGAFSGLVLSELREGFDAKFWPQLNAVQAALPFMRPGGSITFITAISATAKLPGTAGLAAINGALESMVPILAKELQPLRVNAVSPGVIDTAWWDFLPAEARQQVFSDMSARVGVGRVGRRRWRLL